MKTYRVETVPAVLKQLKRIPKNDQKKILFAIEAFAGDPRPQGFNSDYAFEKPNGIRGIESKDDAGGVKCL